MLAVLVQGRRGYSVEGMAGSIRVGAPESLRELSKDGGMLSPNNLVIMREMSCLFLNEINSDPVKKYAIGCDDNGHPAVIYDGGLKIIKGEPTIVGGLWMYAFISAAELSRELDKLGAVK